MRPLDGGCGLKYDTGIRDTQNDALAAEVGPAPVLEVWSGEMPASADDPDSGVIVAAGQLPEKWLAKSAGGQIGIAAPWVIRGDKGGKGRYFRIRGARTLIGSFSDENGAGEMRAKAGTIAPGQPVRIESFDIVRGNA